MPNFPKDEELLDKPCIVCKGTKKYNKDICFHCNGKGTTKWPKRCPGDELREKCLTCSSCKFPPENSKFEVGDIIESNGWKVKITEICFHPCCGNSYGGIYLDSGVHFNDNDGNEPDLKKVGREMKLTEFGDSNVT